MNIHFVGIEGVSMKVLSRIMAARGHRVSGSDIVTTGHDAKYAEGADTLVYTCAVGKDNPEVEYARRKGIAVYERAEFLGKLAREFGHVIAVSGSHGKTTTTGMLGKIFAPNNATVHIGGVVGGECGHVGGGKYFITEACEYKRNFLHIKPEVAVVLNAELDHTDYYTDLEDITDAFRVFANSARVKIINGDDVNSASLCRGNALTFGLGDKCLYRAESIERQGRGFGYSLIERNRRLGEIKLSVEGKHNVYNSLAAAAAARCYGIKFEQIKQGLEEFEGAKRRFELIGAYKGAQVFSDYAHHPSELKSSIESARDAGFKTVTIVFEPHTFSRTLSLCEQFSQALSMADEVLLAPLFPAREAPIVGVSSHSVCRSLIQGGYKACCFDTFYEVIQEARRRAKNGSAIIFAGAGSIDKAAHLLLDENYFT